MPFTDNLFIVFIFLFFPIYFLAEKLSANTALKFTALSSFLFVGFYFPLYAVIPLIQTVFLVQFTKKNRNFFELWVGVVFILLPLLIFKYFDFFATSFGYSFSTGLALPLGISFYTFTAVGFLVDHFHNPKRFTSVSSISVLNFLTYWPHLASGPILRSNTFLFKEITPFEKRDYATALVLITAGLYKKIVIADGVAGYVNQNISLGIDGMSSIDAAATIVGFSVQIYGDFSGYSDMAIGFALLMGVTIPANFNYPYQAVSLTEFWRRWHISLTTWFRDYIYIPLGGNTLSRTSGLLVIMLVFFLSGLWHGAAWNFVIWGGLHGGALSLEKLLRTKIHIHNYIAIFITFSFVSVTWSFFFLSFSDALDLLSNLFVFEYENTPYNVVIILLYLLFVIFDFSIKPYTVNNKDLKATKKGIFMIPVFIFLCMFFAGESQPFIYFDF